MTLTLGQYFVVARNQVVPGTSCKVHLDHVEPLDVESFKHCALLRGVCPAQDPLQTLPSARHVASRGALPVFVPFSHHLPGTAAE